MRDVAPRLRGREEVYVHGDGPEERDRDRRHNPVQVERDTEARNGAEERGPPRKVLEARAEVGHTCELETETGEVDGEVDEEEEVGAERCDGVQIADEKKCLSNSPREQDRHPRLAVARHLLERLERRQQLVRGERLDDARGADERAERGGDGRRDEAAHDDRGVDGHMLHEVRVGFEEVALARRRDAEREDRVHCEAVRRSK